MKMISKYSILVVTAMSLAAASAYATPTTNNIWHVPDSSATVTLLGLAILGLAYFRRKQ